jgi:hypothetical protein
MFTDESRELFNVNISSFAASTMMDSDEKSAIPGILEEMWKYARV